MGLIAVILVSLCFASVVLSRDIPEQQTVEASDASDLELKLVHVVFRHGARTPADTYPNDPHEKFDFAPYGWGQLTNQGRQQLFDNGVYLKSRYGNFLGKTFIPDEVYAQSTGVTRTKMSLQLLLAGFFPPQGTPLEWNKGLNWLPIPYNYEELDKDTLLLVRTTCPRYHEELERVFAHDLADELKADSELYEELTKLTGFAVKTPDDVQSLYSTLRAEQEYGLELPEWTKAYYPDKLLPLAEKSYVYNAYNDELKRLKGGVFIKKVIGDWEKKASENLKTKIFLYAGHDSSVTNILSAFNVWDPQFPTYGITALFEYSQNKKTGEYGVEIFLRNSTTVEPYPLTIPGCGKFCLLKDLKVALKNSIPSDWNGQCKPSVEGFTEPPLGGP